ncbi:MAG TPA: putative metal-binding motif-containing protein [Kofleriaceae bacterium]|nr:putative metal-binding motif-containing protein [Kofleriaceae bacterium]
MRSIALLGTLLGLAVIAAACGGDNTGLVLTIRAPGVSKEARRIEIVLASADPAELVKIDGQPVGGSTRYYSQKSTAGVITLPPDEPDLDGFMVRIEGRGGQGDESFVPLVLAYAGEAAPSTASGEQPIAAGAVLDEKQQPLALEVPAGSRLEATVDLISLQPASPDQGVATGQILALSCRSNGGEVPSGVVWQPSALLQHRLLRPDPASDSPLDATARKLDLDCDGFAMDGGDCDDVRASYNPRATEKCDGQDMNCDGSRFAVTACSLASGTCDGAEGVQLCRDLDAGTPVTGCLPTAECQCQLGACTKCALAFEGGSTVGAVKPCAPGVSMLPLTGPCDAGSPCIVEVLRDDGPWHVTVASDAVAVFDRRAMVTRPVVFLRAKLETSELPKPTTSVPSIGETHIAVSGPAAQSQYLRIDLQLGGSAMCGDVALPGGNYRMECM